MICALLTMLLAEFVSPEENVFQSKSPENTKMGYGKFCDGILRVRPKKKVKMIIINKGCKMAHKKPNTVCLYLILMSRQVKK